MKGNSVFLIVGLTFGLLLVSQVFASSDPANAKRNERMSKKRTFSQSQDDSTRTFYTECEIQPSKQNKRKLNKSYTWSANGNPLNYESSRNNYNSFSGNGDNMRNRSYNRMYPAGTYSSNWNDNKSSPNVHRNRLRNTLPGALEGSKSPGVCRKAIPDLIPDRSAGLSPQSNPDPYVQNLLNNGLHPFAPSNPNTFNYNRNYGSHNGQGSFNNNHNSHLSGNHNNQHVSNDDRYFNGQNRRDDNHNHHLLTNIDIGADEEDPEEIVCDKTEGIGSDVETMETDNAKDISSMPDPNNRYSDEYGRMLSNEMLASSSEPPSRADTVPISDDDDDENVYKGRGQMAPFPGSAQNTDTSESLDQSDFGPGGHHHYDVNTSYENVQ